MRARTRAIAVGGSRRAAIGRLVAAGAVAALVAGPLRAERIVAPDGTWFTATIVSDEAGKVVVRAGKATITLSRADVKAIEKEPPDARNVPPQIVPAAVDPAKAGEALRGAKAAMASGEWLKAGGLLAGLARLDADALPPADRKDAAAALVTCYLRIDQAEAAGGACARRAALADDPDDRRRVLAAAEAFRTLKSTEIDGRAVRTYDEAVAAAVPWKGKALLEEAKAIASQGRMLGAKGRLERTGQLCVEKLREADQYVPGTSGRKREVLQPLVDNILTNARRAVETLTERRVVLKKYRMTSMMNKQIARRWAEQIGAYLTVRQEAQNGLRNLEPFASQVGVSGLYERSEVVGLIETLEDLKYYHVEKEGEPRLLIWPGRPILPSQGGKK